MESLCITLLDRHRGYRHGSNRHHRLPSPLYPQPEQRFVDDYQPHPYRLLRSYRSARVPQCILSHGALHLSQGFICRNRSQWWSFPILSSKHRDESRTFGIAGCSSCSYTFLQDRWPDGREHCYPTGSLLLCYLLYLFHGLVVSWISQSLFDSALTIVASIFFLPNSNSAWVVKTTPPHEIVTATRTVIRTISPPPRRTTLARVGLSTLSE